MYYAYYICPKCEDKLVEGKEQKETENEFNRYEGRCPNCGRDMALACVGSKKMDDTKYKVTIENISDMNNHIEMIMKLGNYSREYIMKRLECGKSITFEGDTYYTFLCMKYISEATLSYTMNPKFLYTRFYYLDICTICGGKYIPKQEDPGEEFDYVINGMCCEKCNDWYMYCYIMKKDLDETIYKVKFSIGDIDCKEKEDTMEEIKKLPDHEIMADHIVISDLAKNIDEILQRLKAMDIQYEVEPPYPHEVIKHREFDEDMIQEILALNAKIL